MIRATSRPERKSKRSLIHSNRHGELVKEYAQCPTPVLLNDKILRVYIVTRPPRDADLQYVSYPTFVDLNRHNLTEGLT
jgi:hypothetical protein